MKLTSLKAAVAAACFMLGAGIASAQTTGTGTAGTANTGSFNSGSTAANTSGTTGTTAATNTTTTSGGTSGTPVGAVPEPETYAMMALGLGLLGYVGRRRKNSDKGRT